MCACMCVHECAHMPCAYGFLQRPEEVLGSSGAGVTGICVILTSYVYGYPREVLVDSSMVGRVRRANCELNLSLVFTMAIAL